MNEIKQPLITRRDAIKKTILFSSGLLAAGKLASLPARAAKTRFSEGLHLLAIGDYGSGNANQKSVAEQMAKFAKKLDAPLTGVLALGDNFYNKLTTERFSKDFEEMYSKEHLNCPFYACLGNHDYGPLYDSRQGPAKAQIQLDYARQNPTSRWKMPAKWYSVELPNADTPLVKIIYLDGNTFEGALTPQEKLEQKRWLEKELAKKSRAPWQWMASHYPIFSDCTKRGDSKRHLQEWGEHLKAQRISLYIAGHDHNLQHLQAKDFDTSFVVSGAGGASLYDVTPTGRGFCEKILGFTHIHVTGEKMQVQFITSEGRQLYAFQRTLKGKVESLAKA